MAIATDGNIFRDPSGFANYPSNAVYVIQAQDGTDITSALQATIVAIASVGGTVLLPPGTFKITSGITVNPTKPIKFIGSGRKLTFLNDVRTDGTDAITVTTEGCYFSDFAIQGNTSQRYGINLVNIYGLGTILERLQIGSNFTNIPAIGFGNETNMGAGICLTTSRYVRIRDCVIGDNYIGVKTIEANGQPPYVCNIYSCDIEHNSFAGIYCNGVTQAPTMFGGTLQFNSVWAFYSIATMEQIKLHDVYMDANGFYASGGANLVLNLASTASNFYTATVGAVQDNIISNVQGIDLTGTVNPLNSNYRTGPERIAIDENSSNVRLEGQETSKFNLLDNSNGNFEISLTDSTHITGWTVTQSLLTMSTVDYKQGTQSLKVTSNVPSSGTAYISQSFANYVQYAGMSVVAGCWAKCPATNTGNQQLQIHGKSGSENDVPFVKDGAWHWYAISYVVPVDAVHLNLYLFVNNGGTINTTDYMLVDDVAFNVGTNNKILRYPIKSDSNVFGSITWDPASLVNGTGVSSSAITVLGASLGDFVLVSAPYDLQGITCTSYVSATNAVIIRLQNESGATVDLASGIWKVRVLKQ